MPNPSTPDSPAAPVALTALAERARAVDGQPPFSDQSIVDLRLGTRRLVTLNSDTAALVSSTEAELVVDPDARGRGLGTRLLDRVIAESEPALRIWAHGDHPAARALAASHGFVPVRTLLQLRMPVPEPMEETPDARLDHLHLDHFRLDHFHVGTDDTAWLALNARAFAFHPEQGSVSQADLDQLAAEPWFDVEDFLTLRDETPGGGIVGYCWLKLEHGIGEFYVVGIDPDRQGEGLGRALMSAGLQRLAARGIRTAALYVEADNGPAFHLYRSLGFTTYSTDIQYARA